MHWSLHGRSITRGTAPRERCPAASLQGKFGQPDMSTIVVHQVLCLLVAGGAVLDLNGRVPDSEVGAELLLNGAHDPLRLGERLIRNDDMAAAGYVLC